MVLNDNFGKGAKEIPSQNCIVNLSSSMIDDSTTFNKSMDSLYN